MPLGPDEVLLDITGFYYQIPVKLSDLEAPPTVEAITAAAVDKFGMTGGKLTKATFSEPLTFPDGTPASSGGFLSLAEVEHLDMHPHSRQHDLDGNEKPPAGSLEKGVYAYDDTASLLKFIAGDGNVSFFAAWQYYIFRGQQLITGNEDGDDLTKRIIVPARRSAIDTPVQAGDVIRWRLVLIGGLQAFIREQIKRLRRQMPEMIQLIAESNTSALEVASLRVGDGE